jgi:hypothetical protein
VVERPGSMNIKTFINGKLSTDFDIVLAPDGSGKAQARGAMGRVVYEVLPGNGKRPMKSSQLDGTCQWAWTAK